MNNAEIKLNRKPVPVSTGRQTGAVLVMGLVLLTVLTLIGVSSMSNSTLEMKAAGNQQRHNVAFQAAQSRLAFASNTSPANPVNFFIVIPDLKDPDTWPVQNCNSAEGCPDGTDWTTTATASYLDCQIGLGNSMESGKGFSFRIFEIRANGQTNVGTAKSVQAGAIRFPVKGCGDEI